MCARVTCIFFLYYCASLTCTVCMYIYICIFNIYCIVRSVTDARDKHTRSDTETRDAPPKFFLFWNGVRERRECALDRAFLVIQHTVHRVSHNFSPYIPLQTVYTSKFLSTPALLWNQTRVKRATAHVYLRYQFLKIFNSIPVDTFSLWFDTCSDDWSRWRMRILVSRPFSMRVLLDSVKNSSRSGYLEV